MLFKRSQPDEGRFDGLGPERINDMQVVSRMLMPFQLFFGTLLPELALTDLSLNDFAALRFGTVFKEVKFSQKVGADLVHMFGRAVEPAFKSGPAFLCQSADLSYRQS